MESIFDFISSNLFETIVVPIIAAVWAWIRRSEKVEQWKAAKAFEFIEAGVAETYNVYVRTRKTQSEDGSLDALDRRIAREKATAYAIQFAKTNGIDLLRYYAKESLPAIIDRIVGERKALGAAAKAALPFFANGSSALSIPAATNADGTTPPLASPEDCAPELGS